MSDPADFLAMFAAVIGTVAWFAWWLRGHIGNERISIKDEQVALARSQRDDLAAKLTEAQTTLSILRDQVAVGANQATITATATSTSAIFKDIQVISDNMGYTLGPSAGAVYSDTPPVIGLTKNSG